MAINDMVGKVLRPLGLMAVMYGCGGGRPSFYYDGMCEDHNRLCQVSPGAEGYDHCFLNCDESSNRYNRGRCAIAYCEVEVNTCLLGDNLENDFTRGLFIDCMNDLGYPARIDEGILFLDQKRVFLKP